MPNNPFAPFDLGQVIGQAEAIKSMRSGRAMDELQAKYLGERIRSEQLGRQQDIEQQQAQADLAVILNTMNAVKSSGRPLEVGSRFFGSPQFQEAARRRGIDGQAFLNTEGMTDADAISNLETNIRALGGEIAGPTYQNVAAGATLLQDGKPVYTAPERPTDDIREYERAREQGFTGTFFDYQQELRRSGATTIDMTQKIPPPPQGMVYVPDPDPNNRLGYRLEQIPGSRDPRTEAQQKAGLLGARMRQLSPDIRDEAPSLTTQMMAEIAQSGGIRGGLAEGQLTPEQQKHFNAARGWLAGVLRGDTGATIQPFEIQEYYPTFFPVPGNSKEVIEQKRKLRKVTEEQILRNAGGVVDEATTNDLPAGVTEEQVQHTMQKYGVSREEVLRRIGATGSQ